MRELENFNIDEETEPTHQEAKEETAKKRRVPVFPEELEKKLPHGTDTPYGVCLVQNAIINIAVISTEDHNEVVGHQAEILSAETKLGQQNQILRIRAEIMNPNGYVIIKFRDRWLVCDWEGKCWAIQPGDDEILAVARQLEFAQTVARKTA